MVIILFAQLFTLSTKFYNLLNVLEIIFHHMFHKNTFV